MPIFTIEKTINGGLGLTKTDEGQVVMVPEALPGEELNIKLGAENKGFRNGKIASIIKAHPKRRTPPCPYIRRCGGCNMQHAEYSLQQEIKTDIVRDLLARSGNSELSGLAQHIVPCQASPQEFGYRQRLRLHIVPHEGMGFRSPKSHELVEIDGCMLARPEINAVLGAIIELESHKHLRNLSSQLELLWNPRTGGINLLYHFTRKPRPTDHSKVAKLGTAVDGIERIFLIGDAFARECAYTKEEGASLSWSYSLDGHADRKTSLSWEVGGFCQVNLEQNRQMIQKALELLDVRDHEDVLDLYCGMGNFSIAVAPYAHTVTGYEGQGSAIRSAKKNAETNGLSNCSFYKKPVQDACAELIAQGKGYHCTIIDPPRQGAPGLARDIAQLTTNRLLYISCDPATLSRDLSALLAEGLSIETIVPIDMFPQTHHIETIVLLKKKG